VYSTRHTQIQTTNAPELVPKFWGGCISRYEYQPFSFGAVALFEIHRLLHSPQGTINRIASGLRVNSAMRARQLGGLLGDLLPVVDRHAEDQSDWQLLEVFITKQDSAAFAALVERHGRLVFGVCSCVLHHEQDTEDAFQATFLVLARMASNIRKRGSLASWLHGVALRTSLKARQAMNTRRRHEQHASTQKPTQPVLEASLRELQALLCEEIGHLDEKYREPFVLCCLEGKTREEAARTLGCKEGTVSSRIAHARAVLESRLARRGVVLPATLTAVTLAPTITSAGMPSGLTSPVVRSALPFATGKAAEAVSREAVRLAESVIHSLRLATMKLLGVVIALALALAGGSVLALSGPAAQDGKAAVPDPPQQKPELARDANPRERRADAVAQMDHTWPISAEPELPTVPGDSLEPPLPPGAFARLGTTRFRPGESVGKLKLSPDGKKLITCDRGGNGLSVWDASTGKLILRRFQGEEGEISRDGERLFVIETLLPPSPVVNDKQPALPEIVRFPAPKPEVKNALRIYQLSTGKLLKQIDGSGVLFRFAIAPDESALALEYVIPNVKTDPMDFAADWFFKTRLELYDLKAGKVLHKLGELPLNYSRNGMTRFSADSKTLFAVGSSKENKDNQTTVRRFDVSTGVLKSKKEIGGSFYHTPLQSDPRKTLIVYQNTIWDLEKEQLLWASRTNELEAIYALMPDGHTLVGLSRSEKLPDGEKRYSRLVHWDMETDREIRRLPDLSFAAISADGKTIFAAAWTYRWLRWDFATGKELESVDAPISPAGLIALSPDGKYVATASGQVRIWERATGKVVHQVPGGPFGNMLFFTPDSKTLVYEAANLRRVNTPAGVVGSLRILDTATWKESTREFEDFVADMNLYYCGMCLSPDGKVLAGPLHVWDWASGKLMGKLEQDVVNYRSATFAFSPDSKKLTYFASPKNHIQVWSVTDKKVINDWTIKENIYRNLHFVKDGELVASSYLPPPLPWKGMPRVPEEDDKPFPPDWPDIMQPLPEAVVCVWEPATGKEKYRLQYPQSENMSDIPPLFSPDGKLMVTANYCDELVRFRDTASGKEVGQFRCGVRGVHTTAFSPDGRVLAVAAKDTTVLLVDVRKVLSKER
jgi:RNA polymerase sigma factor (sigma-70 family)